MIPALIASAVGIISKYIPDVNARKQAEEELTLSLAQGVQRLLEGQLEINKIEAGHPSLFVSGWRPAAGWVCVAALFMYYVPYAAIATGLWLWMTIKIVLLACTSDQACLDVRLPARPDLGITDLIGLLFALLGIGTLRTVERVAGVEPKQAGAPVGLVGAIKGLLK